MYTHTLASMYTHTCQYIIRKKGYLLRAIYFDYFYSRVLGIRCEMCQITCSKKSWWNIQVFDIPLNIPQFPPNLTIKVLKYHLFLNWNYSKKSATKFALMNGFVTGLFSYICVSCYACTCPFMGVHVICSSSLVVSCKNYKDIMKKSAKKKW